MQYEQHLRKTLNPQLIFNEADLPRYLEKAIVKERTRLTDSPEGQACAKERLVFLESIKQKDVDKSDCYKKLKAYHALVQLHQMLQDLKKLLVSQSFCKFRKA